MRKPLAKILQKLSFATLILISCYWSAQTVLKYLSEPTSTTITHQFGDDGEKIEFPMITVCGPNFLYEKVFQNACGLSDKVKMIHVYFQSHFLKADFIYSEKHFFLPFYPFVQ